MIEQMYNNGQYITIKSTKALKKLKDPKTDVLYKLDNILYRYQGNYIWERYIVGHKFEMVDGELKMIECIIPNDDNMVHTVTLFPKRKR